MRTPALITRQGRVADVAARWKEQYFHAGAWDNTFTGSSWRTYDQLVALPADASADDVDQIIGNGSWTAIRCDGCEAEVQEAVEFDSDSADDSPQVVLCRTCIGSAATLIAASGAVA